jgi:cyanate permease
MGQETKHHSSGAILGCAWLLGFAMFGRILCVPPMEHIIKEELLLSYGDVGLVFSLPVVVLAALAIPSGFLADRIGIRKAAGAGAILMAVGSLATSTATSFVTLVAYTCLYGVGFSLVYPNLPKLVGLWFPQEKAGLVTGIYVTGIATGAAVALAITLPIVFPLTSSFPGVFLIWSFPAIVASMLWWIFVKEPLPSHSHVQSQKEGSRNKSSRVVWGNKGLWLVALAFFCLNTHFYAWSGWTPTFMTMKGAPPNLAALIASTMQWVSIPAIFLIPWVSHNVGLRRPFLGTSAIVLALASWSEIYVPLSSGWVLMIIVGIALGGAFPILLALPVEMVPREHVAAASGLVLSVGYVGGLVGPWLVGYIIDSTGTTDLAFTVLIGVAIAWAAIVFILPETGYRAGLQR